MGEVNPNQLNFMVRPTLAPYLCGNYQLTEQGQNLVIHANAQLGKEYAEAQPLPVTNWCYRELLEKLNVLPPSEYGSLLDVCAGTGYVSLNVMRKGLFKRCVALDINPEALKILGERARELGIPGIELQAGNIFDTKFPSESFDCVMGNAFLHHLPDAPAFLREMHRVLKRGGVICLTREPSVSTVKWENLIPVAIKRLLGKRHWPKPEDVPLTDIWQFSRTDLVALFTGVGFDRVEIKGVGRLSHSIATFVDRLFVRFTGAAAPAWVGRLTHFLRFLDIGPSPRQQPDEWAVISISARKSS